MSRSSRTKARIGLLGFTLVALALVLPACRKSPTAKQIKKFADKVCACQDAACAEAVQVEYLEWWKGNMRARGSEGDRKGVEKAMQRYAECNLALVGPESASAPAPVAVPKVNLQRAPAPAPVAPPAEPDSADGEAAAPEGEAAASGLKAAAKPETAPAVAPPVAPAKTPAP
jgi:hypothetical protein